MNLRNSANKLVNLRISIVIFSAFILASCSPNPAPGDIVLNGGVSNGQQIIAGGVVIISCQGPADGANTGLVNGQATTDNNGFYEITLEKGQLPCTLKSGDLESIVVPEDGSSTKNGGILVHANVTALTDLIVKVSALQQKNVPDGATPATALELIKLYFPALNLSNPITATSNTAKTETIYKAAIGQEGITTQQLADALTSDPVNFALVRSVNAAIETRCAQFTFGC